MDVKTLVTTLLVLGGGLQSRAYGWSERMGSLMAELEEKYPDKMGVYVKKLNDESFYSHKGDQLWYIASGVKLPIALEVFRQIDEGKFSLETKLTLRKTDYVDGAGSTNLHKPGSQLSVKYLLEQMIIYSDNTASDLLIHLVGLDPINIYLKQLVPTGFERITSLSEVRRLAYGEVHPSAQYLTGADFLLLKSIKNEKERFQKLREILAIQEKDLKCLDFNQAYSNYYSKNLNSATLRAYGNLLGQIASKEVLSTKSQKLLIEIMSRVQTGKKRIVAGLPRALSYAHKTGTQRSRLCDFGIAWKGSNPNKENAVVIAACVKNFNSVREGEQILKSIGVSLNQSGVFL
ncbi:MAG: serine hydrolase [Bdellovibrio sp.]